MSPAGTDTRGELLAAARRVIRRDGFAGVTVGDITREAGASLGLLNYHFGSKDQVLAEAFDEIARSELAEMEAIARRPDPPAGGSPPASTSPTGATARAGRCGWTPGARRAASRRCG